MAEEMPIVFVVDDDPSVREAIGSLLKLVDLRFEAFESPRAFLNSKHPNVASCLVLDVRFPGLSGLQFQRELTEAKINIPIIFITGHGDVPMSVQAMKDGAIEFLTKPFRDQDLLDAIHLGVKRDQVRRDTEKEVADLRERYDWLTAREREVMAILVTGRLNKQIGAAIGTTESTVKGYRVQIMRKMRAKSLVELIRMADKLGFSDTRI